MRHPRKDVPDLLPDLYLWPVSGKKMLQCFGVLGPDIVFGYDHGTTNVSSANTLTAMAGVLYSSAAAADDTAGALYKLSLSFTSTGFASQRVLYSIVEAI